MTNDAKKLLCKIYKNYLARIKAGELKETARYFDEQTLSKCKYTDILSDENYDDLMELYNQKFITYYGAENSFEMNKKAVEYFQERFKDITKDAVGYLLKLPLEQLLKLI